MVQFDQIPAAPNLLGGVVRPPVVPQASAQVHRALIALENQRVDGVPAYAVPPTAEQHRQAVANKNASIPPAILKVQCDTMLIKSAQKIQQGR